MKLRNLALTRGLLLASALTILAGCTTVQQLSLQPAGAPDSKANGTPISLVPVKVPASAEKYLPLGERIFSLTYWSRGLRCQGYLDVPAGQTALPLLVELHGGGVWANPGHYYGFPVITPSVAAEFAQPSLIVFSPNYGGYGPSQGTIGDSHADFIDTMNGLTALTHISGLRIRQHDTFLAGASLGGMVALLMADQDKEVRGLELISPWPGAKQAMAWLGTQSSASLSYTDLYSLANVGRLCGPSLSSAWCAANSVPYSQVKVPVLLLGGTHDTTIPPDMLKAMYAALKQFDPRVQLNFVSGGHVPETKAAWDIEREWFKTHGLRSFQ